MRMRAAVLEEFGEPLVVQELELTEPKAGEALVRLEACGVCHTDLFTASADQLSPVKHYWSLAIEEQFYLLWPVVLLLLARRALRAGVSVLWPVGALTAVFVIAAPVIGRVFGADAAYWATPARFGEILVGAALACVMRSSWASGRVWRCGRSG